jgi:hypothetical protein
MRTRRGLKQIRGVKRIGEDLDDGLIVQRDDERIETHRDERGACGFCGGTSYNETKPNTARSSPPAKGLIVQRDDERIETS